VKISGSKIERGKTGKERGVGGRNLNRNFSFLGWSPKGEVRRRDKGGEGKKGWDVVGHSP